MDDKELMERELSLMKGVTTLYLNGAIESETKEVHDAFKCALDDSLNIQNKIYNLMKEKGWYPTELAEQKKINSVKEKFNI